MSSCPFSFYLVWGSSSLIPKIFFAGIKGITLPIAQSIVLDVEFANDTTLYVDGEIGNLG